MLFYVPNELFSSCQLLTQSRKNKLRTATPGKITYHATEKIPTILITVFPNLGFCRNIYQWLLGTMATVTWLKRQRLILLVLYRKMSSSIDTHSVYRHGNWSQAAPLSLSPAQEPNRRSLCQDPVSGDGHVKTNSVFLPLSWKRTWSVLNRWKRNLGMSLHL